MGSRYSGFLLIILCVWFFAGMAYSAPLSNQPYDVLLDGVKTSSIPWAVPYVGGKIKALVIAPTWSQRETIELAQRLSLDYKAIMTYSYTGYDQGVGGYMVVSPEIVRATADQRIKGNYDVIILGKMDWKVIPSHIRLEILRKVIKGSGLLYVCPPTDNSELNKLFSGTKISTGSIFPGVNINNWPAFKSTTTGPIIKLSKFGKGIVGVLDYPEKDKSPYQSLTPSTGGYPQSRYYYDLYQALLAKMVVRVSGKTSEIRIVNFKADPKSIHVDLSSKATIELKIYDEDSLESTRSIRAKYLHLTSHELKDGLHFISVRILSDGKVLDWCGDTLNINRTAKIQEIVFNKKYLNKSDSVSGIVKLNPATASDRVVLKAWDTHGRMFGYTSLPAARSVRFRFPVSTSLSCVNRIQAVLVSKGLTVSQKSAEFTIKQEYDPLDFSMIMWLMEIPEDDYLLSRVYMNQLYKSGVDTAYEYFTIRLKDEQLLKEVRMLTSANLRIIPYCFRIFPDSVADNIRKPCLSDPEHRKYTRTGLVRQARIFHPYSVDSYSLGDEDILADGESDVCFSPTCLAGFKKYLKDVYGTLDALNTEWDSAYTDWGQILPSTTEQARKSGKTAPWLDFRLYMENVYTDYNMYATTVIRSIEPKAKVGAEGYYDTTSWAGYNWPNLLTDNQVCGLYSNPSQREIVRSFARKDSVTGTWYGTYTGALYEAAVRSHPWDSLFHKQNSAFWYNSCHSVGAGGGSIFTPDFTPIPAYAQTMQEINEIKRGIGKLILSADQATDGVAILYSQPSLHAASLNPIPITQKTSWEAFILGLEDCRYQYRFVSTKQLASGGLKSFKVLILPFAQALSRAESKAILAFAQMGGIVVADYPAGVMDEHGKALPESSLADLLDTSKALTETRLGKGKGIYTGGHTDLSANLLRLLSKHGVKPGVRLTTDDGKSAVSAGTSVFKLGAIKYVCIMPTQGIKRPLGCLLGIGARAHIYDVRSGKYLGFSDKARITLRSARAAVVAFSPYKITGITIRTSTNIVRQGQILKVAMSLKANQKASDHVFHLSVVDPKGREKLEYCRNVIAKHGLCSASIPFSLNDTRGKWIIRVTDITGGVRDEKSIRID